jgi:CspA family cold shock protein
MPTGKVKSFNPTKGYGFILPDDGGNDVFVHRSSLERSGMLDLVEGQKVSFDVEINRRSGKPAAINIRPAQ